MTFVGSHARRTSPTHCTDDIPNQHSILDVKQRPFADVMTSPGVTPQNVPYMFNRRHMWASWRPRQVPYVLIVEKSVDMRAV